MTHGAIDTFPDKNFHLLCEKNSADGCPRCRPKKILVCCDLCHPDAFAHLKPPPPLDKTRTSARSSIKSMPMNELDLQLRDALRKWRDEKAPLKFPAAFIQNFGAKVFISDDLIARIVLCAHAGKLTSKSNIQKETKWRPDLIEEFGDSLLSVVHRYYPTKDTSSAPSARRRPGPITCGACGEQGHRSNVLPDSSMIIFCIYKFQQVRAVIAPRKRKQETQRSKREPTKTRTHSQCMVSPLRHISSLNLLQWCLAATLGFLTPGPVMLVIMAQ